MMEFNTHFRLTASTLHRPQTTGFTASSEKLIFQPFEQPNEQVLQNTEKAYTIIGVHCLYVVPF